MHFTKCGGAVRNVLIAIAVGMATATPVAASDNSDVMEVRRLISPG